MTPDQIAKPDTESAHQQAFFAYCAVAAQCGFVAARKWAKGLPMPDTDTPVQSLRWIHAIPNGGTRGDTSKSRAIAGGRMKAEGVRPGIPDVFLPHARTSTIGNWHGLYIEFKAPSKQPKTPHSPSGLTPEQTSFRSYALSQGYWHAVCYTWQDAVAALENYYGVTKN